MILPSLVVEELLPDMNLNFKGSNDFLGRFLVPCGFEGNEGLKAARDQRREISGIYMPNGQSGAGF
jgi:hypothetical protein